MAQDQIVASTTTEPGSAVIGAEAERRALEVDPTAAHDVERVDATGGSFSDYVSAWIKRVRSGESGALPVVAGLIAIIVIFESQNSVFLSAGNIVNLLEQGAVFVLLGMAEIFVLLLGEIDLSTGFVAGVGAVVTVALSAPPTNWPWTLAIAAGVASTAVIGIIQGELITRLRLPSFVVTLAGYLGWFGFLIFLIDKAAPTSGGTIRLTNSTLEGLVNGTMSVAAGWIAMAVIVGVFGIVQVTKDTRRRASGLVAPPVALTYLKIAAMAVAGIVLVAICNTNRSILAAGAVKGVPWVVPIVLGFVAAWSFVLTRTRFGRHIYAIGGNSEASRRAGINLRKTRVTCFALCSLTAGAAGIIYASRLGSISNNIDGGTLVLYGIAAAVIGGTSLFGGRGKMINALLGGLVIAAIYNGMGLLGLSAATQYMVTALVLLAAVTVDAVARRGATG